MRSIVATLLGVLCLQSAGCDGPTIDNCLDGSSSTASGTLSLVTSSTSGAEGDVQGTTSSFTMDNFDPGSLDCAGGATFLVHGGSCQLHAVVATVVHDSGRYSSDELIDATADIVPDSSLACILPTSTGYTSVAVSSGSLDVTDGSMTLDVAGTSSSGASVTLHFSGVWQ